MNIPCKSIVLKNGFNVQLRSPKPSEAELLIKHLQITHAESYRNLNNTADYWKNFSVVEEEKILTDFESSNCKFMLNAFYQDKIIGGLSFVGGMGNFLKHNARIGMSIQKAYFNIGLGRAMIEYALATAREAGFHRVELTVRTFNDSGIALYEKAGFKRVGLLKDVAFIDNAYVDEYLYQLIL